MSTNIDLTKIAKDLDLWKFAGVHMRDELTEMEGKEDELIIVNLSDSCVT